MISTIGGGMTWKKALIGALIIVLVVIGLPVLMHGMDMASCPECGPAVMAGPCIPLFFSALVLLVVLASFLLRRRRTEILDLLRAFLLDRPPQLT